MIAVALFVSGVVHLGVLLVSGGSWSGPLSFRKPATFGLSFGLTLATVTWVLGLLPLAPRTHRALLGVFAAASVIEVVLISVQAWRGQPSHFGITGPGAGLISAGAAVGGAAIVVTMVIAAASTLRPMPSTSPSMRLALRAGFASLLVSLALGVVMLGGGMILARGAGDLDGAFRFTAGLKAAHGATMYGVLMMPALAWVLSRAKRPERFRVAVVRVAVVGYALAAGATVIDTIVGADPLTSPAIAAIITGTLILAGATAVALHTLAPPAAASPANTPSTSAPVRLNRSGEATTPLSTAGIHWQTVAAADGSALVIAVDDQSGVVRSILEAGTEFDESGGERSLLVEGGAVIDDPHRQRHDVRVESGEVCQQYSIGADHGRVRCRRRRCWRRSSVW